MYYIYILYSQSSDRYYVGFTENIEQRIDQHNHSERVTYTSKHRPWELVALFECGFNRTEAIRLERFIKNQRSRKLTLELLDPTFYPTGKLAQLVRVPHLRD